MSTVETVTNHEANLEQRLEDLIDDSKIEQLKIFVELNFNQFDWLFRNGKGLMEMCLSKKQFFCFTFMFTKGFRLKYTEDHPYKCLTWNERWELSREMMRYFVPSDEHLEKMSGMSPLVEKLIKKSKTPPFDRFRNESFDELRKKYEKLEAMPGNKAIMEIVANCPKVEIFYDPYNNYVCNMQPFLSRVFGACDYWHLRIFICCGGGDEYDLNTIIHEFLHYCMLLVYDNMGLPYLKEDLDRKVEYFDLFKTCHEIFNANPSAYKDLKHLFAYKRPDKNGKEILKTKLSELIVMPGSLKVLLMNEQPELEKHEINFQLLFDFYEDVVYKDMLEYSQRNKDDECSH